MNHLIPLMKKIEIELRSGLNISKENWESLSELTDWEYRIIQDFILRVNLHIQNNNMNFVYKFYKDSLDQFKTHQGHDSLDLLIVSLKRDKTDVVLTDIFNRMPTPHGITRDYLEIWGEQVTRGRNFAVKEALRRNAKYLIFLDDDIIAPQGALMKLFKIMNQTDHKVVAGHYYRKMEPLMSAHGSLTKNRYFPEYYETDMCAMGLVLMDIDYISQHVPLPLFWEFGAPDGYWSMGEDAFFTKNIYEYAGVVPLVDPSIKLLHFDKIWKKWYGDKDHTTVYATNAIENLEQFESLRKPNKFPLITISTPLRTNNDIIAADINKMLLLRGYRNEAITCHGMRVDDARTELVKHALKLESDYVLFLDNDIIPPIDGLCRLIETLENNEDVGCVTGDYCLKGCPTYSAHLQLNNNGMVTELDRLNLSDKLVHNDWLIGLGFALIKTEFFKQARTPWFKCHTRNAKNIDVNEDAHFSELMFENGYNIFIDQSVKCLHVDFENKVYYGFEQNIDLSQYAYNEILKHYKYIDYESAKKGV